MLGQLGVVRKIRCDAHLQHDLHWHLLSVLRPLGQKVLDLLLYTRMTGGDIEKHNHFRAARHEQLPSLRWGSCFFAGQPFGEFLGIIFYVLPLLDESLVRDETLDGTDVLLR